MHLEPVPTLAWGAIVIIIVITFFVNLILFVLLRNPQGLRKWMGQMRMPKTGHSMDTLRKTTEVMRHPFAEEDRQLNELSGLLRGLENSSSTDQQENNQNQNLPKK